MDTHACRPGRGTSTTPERLVHPESTVMKTVVLVGTLDTKGREIAYVAERIRAAGLATVVVDSGILGQSEGVEPDVRRDEVASAGGTTLDAVRATGSRGAATERMAIGLRAVLAGLYREGRCHGVLALGGAEGAVMAAHAVQILPIGIPKLIVTPVAAGHRSFGPFVGLRDVTLMHSVVDILGLNPVSRAIFDNAAAAVAGMVRAGTAPPRKAAGDRLVAITMLGNTTPAVMRLERRIASAGYTPVIFHANGVGGQCMEELIGDGFFAGVVDFTTDELTDQLVGGFHAAGPGRLGAAARHGVPQVVVPGCVDFFVFGPRASIPERWQQRPQYLHNPALTLVRASRAEMVVVARTMAEQLNAARGRVAVAVPLGGLSIPNRPGDLFWDPEADAAFRETLRTLLRADIPVIEVSAHINDAAFVDAVFALFVEVMAAGGDAPPVPDDPGP
jgi:uncharacterized protein (UPF0261 family)